MSDNEIIKFLVEIHMFLSKLSKGRYPTMEEVIQISAMNGEIERVVSRLKGEV